MELFYRAIIYDDLSKEEKQAIWNDPCEICGTVYDIQIDHDHVTGLVRGSLCGSCNRMVGLAEAGLPLSQENRDRAAAYLECRVEEFQLNDRFPFVPWGAEVENHKRMTNLVEKEVAQLRSDTWKRREEPGAIERKDEIVALVEDQRQDGLSTAGDHRSKVGRQWILVFPNEWMMDDYFVTKQFTADQVAFQAGIEPVLGELTGEERILIHYIYDRQFTTRSVAELLNTTNPTITRRLQRLHKKLRTMLTD